MLLCIIGIGAACFVMEKINFAGIVFLFRIDVGYLAGGSQLNTLNRVLHKIRSNLLKFGKLPVSVDDNFLHAVGDLDAGTNVLSDPIGIGDGIDAGKVTELPQIFLLQMIHQNLEQNAPANEKQERKYQ